MAERDIAPNPQFPERSDYSFQRKMGDNSKRRGPLRFQEGINTDTDVPNDFGVGISQGNPDPSRPNHNANVFEKPAAETLRERAHLGSASWIEADSYLSEFAHGTSHAAERTFERIFDPERRVGRHNPVTISD